MRFYLAVIGLSCLLGGTAACTRRLPDTRHADVQTIKDLEAAWRKIAAQKDAAKFAAYFADDARVLSPNQPLITGRDKIQAGLTSLMADPNFVLTFQASRVEPASGGDMVYTIGEYARTVTDAATKQPVTDRGHYLTIWQKQSDGNWKVTADMDNSQLPPAASH